MFEVEQDGSSADSPPCYGMQYVMRRQYGPPFFSQPIGETGGVPNGSYNSGYDFFFPWETWRIEL